MFNQHYLSIVNDILINGITTANRTDHKSKFIPSATITHDMRKGFPLLSCRKLAYKSGFAEIIGFIKGFTNADDFAKLGCSWWYANANKTAPWVSSPFRKGDNDLGIVYGATWRKRTVLVSADTHLQIHEYMNDGYAYHSHSDTQTTLYKEVDQLADVIDKITNNPNDRRIIMHAWFPELFCKMALPPCLLMYTFTPDPKNKVLHMTATQRSADMYLGVPFNLAGSGLLLTLIAKACGYEAGKLTLNMTNCHLYENQFYVAETILHEWYRDSGKINILIEGDKNKKGLDWIESVEPKHIQVDGYDPAPAQPKVEMAV